VNDAEGVGDNVTDTAFVVVSGPRGTFDVRYDVGQGAGFGVEEEAQLSELDASGIGVAHHAKVTEALRTGVHATGHRDRVSQRRPVNDREEDVTCVNFESVHVVLLWPSVALAPHPCSGGR